MNDIIKIANSLEKFGLLTIGVSETIQNEAKVQKAKFLGTFFGTLGATLLWNLLTGIGKIRTGASSFSKFLNTKVLQDRT